MAATWAMAKEVALTAPVAAVGPGTNLPLPPLVLPILTETFSGENTSSSAIAKPMNYIETFTMLYLCAVAKMRTCAIAPFACRWGEFAIREAGAIHLWKYGNHAPENKIDGETMSSSLALIDEFYAKKQLEIIGCPRTTQLKKDGLRLRSYLSKHGNCAKTYNATENMKVHKD
ncbi:MAG: hypothetical protein LBI81_03865 [Puniceicoccales bacterium]|nr:hypothetical protein [Puniceicoccales bacterium]